MKDGGTKMNKMRITFISDTHARHRSLKGTNDIRKSDESIDLPGGDLLVHAGDFMTSGYSKYEAEDFCNWLGDQDYDLCAFIAGNHDRLFEIDQETKSNLIKGLHYRIEYLEDSYLRYGDYYSENPITIYGSPWQPEFYNWAFNLPRGGKELEEKWAKIPDNVDILITHGPPQDHLDVSGPPWNTPHLGCELLRVRVDKIKPKIHVFGHIHGGYGYKFYNGTHFINASVLNERYDLVNPPITVDWDPETNELEFIK